MKEKELQQLIHRTLGSRKDTRLFRNQVGVYRLEDGRVIASGLHKGSADLIGWQTVEVTPEMVGKKLAVFLSVEVKTETGRVSPEQSVWLDVVKKAGGIAFVARNLEELDKNLL